MGRDVFMLSLITICLCLYNAESKQLASWNEWDVLIFTQQWPTTVCDELHKHHPSHKCSMPPKKDSWSVHGIWPTKLGTIGPQFCNRTWLFDPDQVKPIETQLAQSWTNIDAGSSPYSFWAHEWLKHGTCAAVLDTLNSEAKYFSKGLEWLGKYSMTKILSDSNIVPSNDNGYKIIDIHNAIKAKLGINAAIECRKEDGISTIVEIRICFDKNLQLHNCDGIMYEQRKLIRKVPVLTNCDPSQEIMYPHYNEGSVWIQVYKMITFLQWLMI